MSAVLYRRDFGPYGYVEVVALRGKTVLRIAGEGTCDIDLEHALALWAALPAALVELGRILCAPPSSGPKMSTVDYAKPGFGAAVKPGARVGPAEPYRGSGT